MLRSTVFSLFLAAPALAQCNPGWAAPLGSGTSGPVEGLAAWGSALYATGNFTAAGGAPAAYIARWDGSSWASLGAGLPAEGMSLVVFAPLGQSPALYAGGFATFGTSTLNRWNGSAWSPVGGSGVWVGSMGIFDGGAGPELIISGGFSVPSNYIARWNGSSWGALGQGNTGVSWSHIAFDDGSGPALYIAGDFPFVADQTPGTGGLARWNGHAWSSVGGGVNPTTARSLAVFDDGSGPALIAGGDFVAAGGVPVTHVAKWNGQTWSPLGAGVNGRINAMAAFDDGRGPALYATGTFTTAGGAPASRIARWRNGAWSALGAGLNGAGSTLCAFDPDGSGPAPAQLVVGGTFTLAGGIGVQNIAAWSACPPCYANCDNSAAAPVLNVNDFQCFLNRFSTGDPYANCDGSTAPPTLNVNDFQCFLNAYALGCP